MHKRAINVVLTGATGVSLAGMLVAGVSAASEDDAARQKNLPATQAMAAHNKQSAAKAAKAQSKAAPAKKAAPKKAAPAKKAAPKALLSGKTTASYFWDDGSGVNGDTGAPAGGKPMQKGLFASPSWPMHTKVKVTYGGRSVVGFVGDRGPGAPSHSGVMLDLDTYTFRYLLDGKKPESDYEAGTGEGHLKGLKYEVLEWGEGAGKKGEPVPF
ncbi:hypothetical protein [Spirillospora sp. CA-294931]|uniref:hypothetical protein n=1 Tax=Spirillospora sp. CA-294931 TaxID=3240042 RepID=UPI003D8CEDB0